MRLTIPPPLKGWLPEHSSESLSPAAECARSSDRVRTVSCLRQYRNRSCATGRMTIRRRDVVLVRFKDNMPPALMRVVHVWGTLLLLREDSSYAPYESATVSDILGVVVEGTCRGGRHFNSSSRKWRYASKAWTASYRPRLWAGKIRRYPTKSAISMLAVLTVAVILSCVDKGSNGIIRIEDGQFVKHDTDRRRPVRQARRAVLLYRYELLVRADFSLGGQRR